MINQSFNLFGESSNKRAKNLALTCGVLFLCASLTFASICIAATTESRYASTTADRLITGTSETVLLSQSITLSSNAKVLVSSDGRYFPNVAGIASVSIRVDGSGGVASDATIDWSSSSSTNPVQHSYNSMGLIELSAGTHTVKLVAFNISTVGSFYVGANSNLSIMVNPAPTSLSSVLLSDGPIVDLNTYDPPSGLVINDGDNRPWSTLLSHTVNSNLKVTKPVISFISGRAHLACISSDTNTPPSNLFPGEGDVAWGILSDQDQCFYNDASSWGVNDIYSGAEHQAPISAIGYNPLNSEQSVLIRFGGGELAFNDYENGVCYKAGAQSRLLSFYGMGLSGRLYNSSTYCSSYAYQCVASNSGWPTCPATGSTVTLASGTIVVPQGHNGVVYLSARTNVQGDFSDPGGNFMLGIKIDGVNVGSGATQQLNTPNGASRRTLSASYLTASGGTSSSVLTPGTHSVEVYGRATGNFIHLSATKGLTLVYFD